VDVIFPSVIWIATKDEDSRYLPVRRCGSLARWQSLRQELGGSTPCRENLAAKVLSAANTKAERGTNNTPVPINGNDTLWLEWPSNLLPAKG